MRIATAVAIFALPALVVGGGPAPAYGRHEGRQLPIISNILGGDKESTSTTKPTTPLPPKTSTPPTTSKPSMPPTSSTTSDISTTSLNTTTTTSTSTSTTPSSTTSQISSEPPTTTEAETTSTPTTTAEKTSDVKPIVSVVTETVNGIATVVPVQPSNTGKKEEGLPKGAIIGIAVGASLAGVILLSALIFGLCRRTRRSSDDEAIRWPELNRHGDSSTVHALPAHRSDSGERRMSLGDELDGPQYLSDEHLPTATQQYDEKAYGFERSPSGYSAGNLGPGAYTGEDYSSFPPPVQPQPSPVHGVDYDEYEWNPAYGDQYAPQPGGGVASSGSAFPQPHPTHHY